MSEGNPNQHITPYTLYAKVLITLLVLTFITVSSVHLSLGGLAVAVVLLIACTKGTLVLTYFMHLKFDQPVFRIMLGLVIFLFATFIILTMVDYLFR
jgi:cytochrome c oxidase subunit IV